MQDWSADGAPAPAAAAPAAISAPASGYQVRNSLKYFHILKYFLSPGDRGLVRPDRDQRLGRCQRQRADSTGDDSELFSRFELTIIFFLCRLLQPPTGEVPPTGDHVILDPTDLVMIYAGTAGVLALASNFCLTLKYTNDN